MIIIIVLVRFYFSRLLTAFYFSSLSFSKCPFLFGINKIFICPSITGPLKYLENLASVTHTSAGATSSSGSGSSAVRPHRKGKERKRGAERRRRRRGGEEHVKRCTAQQSPPLPSPPTRLAWVEKMMCVSVRDPSTVCMCLCVRACWGLVGSQPLPLARTHPLFSPLCSSSSVSASLSAASTGNPQRGERERSRPIEGWLSRERAVCQSPPPRARPSPHWQGAGGLPRPCVQAAEPH